MLHNKYFEILSLFLCDYNREIYGRELVGKIPLSQKAIALALDELEKQGILKSRKLGNIKYFKLNIENTEIKDLIISLEIMKKIKFLEKHRKIANIFRKDSRIVGIFGSYAKGIEKKDSDIDVFIVGKIQREDYNKKGEAFDLNISIKYFSEKEFKTLVKKKNNLCKEIIADHILIFGAERFIEIIWREYYGFN